MPWDNKSIFEQRWLMLQKFFKEKAPVTRISREFGVSRKTFYKFKHRFAAEGVIGLKDRSRAPHHRPRKIPPIVEEAIVELRFKHPDFGPVRLQAELKKRFVGTEQCSVLTLSLERLKGFFLRP